MAADQTDWKAQYDELLRNHEDYKESRAQAEEELENELLTAEERSVEFELKYEEEKQAKEIIMTKSKEKHEESMQTIQRLQEQLDYYRRISEELGNERQQLEQQNDDLERREREMMATIEDLEERTDILTEKEAILSLELEELRVSSQEVIQRLKDEIRDHKHELNVRSLELDAMQREMPLFAGRAPRRVFTSQFSPRVLLADLLSIAKLSLLPFLGIVYQ